MRTSDVGALAIFALFGCSGSGGTPKAGHGQGPGGERAIPVVTAAAVKRDMPIYVDGLGTVTAYKTVTVRARVDGRLDQVQVKEGQAVKKGDLLAQVDPRPFVNQLHQAEAQLAHDQAVLDTNRVDLKRYEVLVTRKLISPQQADDQRGLVAQNEASVQLDRATVDVAKLNLDYARVVSPIDGVAGIRNIDAGNIVHAADPAGIVTLTQLDPIALIFTLPQDVLPQVALHQGEGDLEVIASSRDGTEELGRGKLEVIDNLINPSTATLRLKAVLPNPQHRLWPNQFVKARLMLTVKNDALVIPAPALQRGPTGTFVYVVAAGETAEVRSVVVELLQGNDAIVSEGVEDGDVVVTEGQSQLKPGSKVALRAKAGDPAPAPKSTP